MTKIKLPFIKHNIATYSCDNIGVYDSDNNLICNLDISSIKPNYKKRLYRFGLLSDVHHNDYPAANPSQDFQNALSVFNEKESVNFTCICGDITENHTYTELHDYVSNVNTYSPYTPVYTTTGNHDANCDSTIWKNYVGLDKEYFEFTYNGDHFIFLGMYQYNFRDAYSEESLTMLENALDTYKNERCFIFTHLFFPYRAGNFKYAYPSGNWLNGEQLTRLERLNDTYPNCFWFSGHSHWKWYLQKHQRNANVYGKECGWNIHVPSCASPIDSKYAGVGKGNNGTAWSRDNIISESEGAIVDVYDDCIEIRGVSFKQVGNDDYNFLYIPCAQYRLSVGSGNNDIYEHVVDVDFSNAVMVTANDFTHNTNKSNPVSVKQLSDDYIELRFDGNSQGFNVSPSNMFADHIDVFLNVIDVKYYTASNANPDVLTAITTTPIYVGFYGISKYVNEERYSISNEFLCSTIDADDEHPYSCVFQTSSKFVSNNSELNIGTDATQNQLVIQMKVKLAYN